MPTTAAGNSHLILSSSSNSPPLVIIFSTLLPLHFFNLPLFSFFGFILKTISFILKITFWYSFLPFFYFVLCSFISSCKGSYFLSHVCVAHVSFVLVFIRHTNGILTMYGDFYILKKSKNIF